MTNRTGKCFTDEYIFNSPKFLAWSGSQPGQLLLLNPGRKEDIMTVRRNKGFVSMKVILVKWGRSTGFHASLLFPAFLLRNCLENRASIGRNFTSVSFLQKLTDDNKTRQWDGLLTVSYLRPRRGGRRSRPIKESLMTKLLKELYNLAGLLFKLYLKEKDPKIKQGLLELSAAIGEKTDEAADYKLLNTQEALINKAFERITGTKKLITAFLEKTGTFTDIFDQVVNLMNELEDVFFRLKIPKKPGDTEHK